MSLRGVFIVVGLVGSMAGFLAGSLSAAHAQATDYSAGKTPAQLFSSDCSSCHKSPRGLAKARDARALTGFLREHYTSKSESAGALATYLIGLPGTAADAAAEKRRQGATPAQSATPQSAAAQAAAAAADKRRPQARGRKPDPAEAAREAAEAAREAAKAAEEAAMAKLRAYALTGETARPLAVEAPPPPVETAPAVPPPASEEPAPAPAQNPEAGTAPAEAPPVAGERPEAAPPG